MGLLDRLGIARRIKFSPEQATARQMMRLADLYLRQKVPCLVLMFHSSSLVPGQSPYVPDTRALEGFYRRLERVFEHCLVTRGCRNAILSELADEVGAFSRMLGVS
ncbi:MAG: hypothetical protein GXP27_10730 [Planctomycetes bacterium]|nr:hypothetical protein [Planctomycetota bacterium]